MLAMLTTSLPLGSMSLSPSVLMSSLGSARLRLVPSSFPLQVSMSLNSFLPHHTPAPRTNTLIPQADWPP